MVNNPINIFNSYSNSYDYIIYRTLLKHTVNFIQYAYRFVTFCIAVGILTVFFVDSCDRHYWYSSQSLHFQWGNREILSTTMKQSRSISQVEPYRTATQQSTNHMHTPDSHDDVIKWKPFPCYWSFVWGMYRSPVNSPHKDHWRGALMFSLICVWTDTWANSGDTGDLRPHHTHYDVIVMIWWNVSEKFNILTTRAIEKRQRKSWLRDFGSKIPFDIYLDMTYNKAMLRLMTDGDGFWVERWQLLSFLVAGLIYHQHGIGFRLTSGSRLNIKTVLSTYGDFHVKDKTAVRTSYL